MHKCLQCKKTYSDDEVPIVQGCSCGGRLFLYIKGGGKEPEITKEIEEEIFEKIEEIDKEQSRETHIIDDRKPITEEKGRRKFGIETIRVKDLGIYEINIDALMRGRPIIVLSKGGSYIISLPSAFDKGEETVKSMKF